MTGCKKFVNPDVLVYKYNEIIQDLSYFKREFILEYLSKGLCLYGTNILKTKFEKITNKQYRESIVIRSAEHLQKVRTLYYNNSVDVEYKRNVIEKYIIRLSRNIIMLNGINTYDKLEMLSNEEVLDILYDNYLINHRCNDFDNSQKSLEYYFKLFNLIANNLTLYVENTKG